MKKLILTGLFCLLLASPSWAVIARVAALSGGAGAGAGTFTTGTWDTTGANLIVCGVSGSHSAWPTFSDNMSNGAPSAITRQVVNSTVSDVGIIYWKNPTVGSGHTITVTGASNLASIGCLAFSGADTVTAIDVSNGATSGATSVHTLSTGSIAATSGDVAVTIIYNNGGTAYTISDTFTIEETTSTVGGQHFGHVLAYKIDPGTVNPHWDWTTDTVKATSIAAFLPAAGGGGSTAVQSSGGFMGSIIK